MFLFESLNYIHQRTSIILCFVSKHTILIITEESQQLSTSE